VTPHVDPLFALSGFFVGLLVGQTGMGGGSLMTPILVLLFGIHPATAVGTDLLYASATKTVGTLVHGLNHTVVWRIVGRLAMGSVPATVATLLVISRFDIGGRTAAGVISTVLGVTLLLTSLSLIFRERFLALLGGRLGDLTPADTARATVLTGAVLGVLVTISSVIAHAVPLTLVAGVGHWWLGSVDWPLLVSLLCGSVPGIMLGSYLSAKIPDFVLRPILAVTLVVVGARLVF